ncbi:MAG TPA: sialidase family protein, partial [Isosphaeraceae bacterium]|nr:sialidase family protein [Isosphaeraceae bacterium]
MRPFLTMLLMFGFALPGSVHAADGTFEEMDLFEAGKGGYAHYRIPGIVVTAKGTVLAYAEARKHARSDWGTIDLVMRRGPEGGKTWEPVRKIAEPPTDAKRNPVAEAQKLGHEGEITLNNPVMIAEPSGPVHLLYCVEYGRCFVRHSQDD